MTPFEETALQLLTDIRDELRKLTELPAELPVPADAACDHPEAARADMTAMGGPIEFYCRVCKEYVTVGTSETAQVIV